MLQLSRCVTTQVYSGVMESMFQPTCRTLDPGAVRTPDVYLWKGRGSFTIQSACVLSTYRKLRMRSPGCPCWLYRVCDWTSRFSSELEARERLPLARSRLEVAWMGDWMDGPQHCSSRIICRQSRLKPRNNAARMADSNAEHDANFWLQMGF